MPDRTVYTNVYRTVPYHVRKAYRTVYLAVPYCPTYRLPVRLYCTISTVPYRLRFYPYRLPSRLPGRDVPCRTRIIAYPCRIAKPNQTKPNLYQTEPTPQTHLRGPGIHSTRASSSKSLAIGSYRRLTTARLGAGNGGDSRGQLVDVSCLASASAVTDEGVMPLAMAAAVAGAAVRASRTCLDRGPDMRTTATPAGPALPVDRAKMVSSEEGEEDAIDAADGDGDANAVDVNDDRGVNADAAGNAVNAAGADDPANAANADGDLAVDANAGACLLYTSPSPRD